MTKQEFITWAKAKGWQEDKFGHLQKVSSNDSVKMRFKLSSISVRYERQIHFNATEYSRVANEWIRLGSAYFKDLSISDNDKLVGLKR